MSRCQTTDCTSQCHSDNQGTPYIDSEGEPAATASMFSIPKMDCPSEENLIRMALNGVAGVSKLMFDLRGRRLTVVHTGEPSQLLEKLVPLGLGATLLESKKAEDVQPTSRTLFSIPKMDCPSEENLIRMALADTAEVRSLTFDLKNRELTVVHIDEPAIVLARLDVLQLGATQVATTVEAVTTSQITNDGDLDGDKGEAKVLKILLAINGAMFVFELVLGLIAQSTGLIADSLDMFADAAVYGLALYAVGRAASLKVKAAHIAGWLQVVLAIGALTEVVRRVAFGSEPQSGLMMGIGLVALLANVTCLVLISKKRDRGAHMTASYIFSANDVIANSGVIAAGALVAWTGSSLPDLVIGTVIGLVVLNGARRILKLR